MPQVVMEAKGQRLWRAFTDFEENWKHLCAVENRVMTGPRSWSETREGREYSNIEVVNWNPEVSFTINNLAGGVLWVTDVNFTEDKVEFIVKWKTRNPIMLLMTPLIKKMMRKGMAQDIKQTIEAYSTVD